MNSDRFSRLNFTAFNERAMLTVCLYVCVCGMYLLTHTV